MALHAIGGREEHAFSHALAFLVSTCALSPTGKAGLPYSCFPVTNILLGQPVAVSTASVPSTMPTLPFQTLPACESSPVSLSGCFVLTSHGKPTFQTPTSASTHNVPQSVPPLLLEDFCIEANIHPNHNDQTHKGMVGVCCPPFPLLRATQESVPMEGSLSVSRQCARD